MTVTLYVAFLRAVNVAGHARVRMSDVRSAFIAAGCQDVRSCVQSGNIIFRSPGGAAAVLRRVRAELEPVLGEAPVVLLRTAHAFQAMVAGAPFTGVEGEPGVKRYVAFLSREPRTAPVIPLHSPKEALTAVATKRTEVFIVSRRKSSGFYGLPNNFIEQQLGVAATTRNWSTLAKIAAVIRKATEP